MSSREETITEAAPPYSIVKKVGLGILFFGLLFFFTLTKLPQAKITALIQGHVQSALDPYGIYVTDHGREFSVWKGFQYRLIQPTLELADQTRVELEEMVISPKFGTLFGGKVGARVDITQILDRTPAKTTYSTIHAEGTIRGDLINASVKLEDVDIGKFGILSFAGGLKGSGQVGGDIRVDGHLADIPSLAGEISLKLKKLRLEEQNLFGFQLPTMDISDGTISSMIEKGKLVLKQVQVGRTNDDLHLSVTGDIALAKNLNSSTLNMRAVLGFSDKVKQSLSLLDSILGAAKQADGNYVYKLTGTFAAPFPVPDVQK